MAAATTPLLPSQLLGGGVPQQWQMALLAVLPVLLVSSYLLLTSRSRSRSRSGMDDGGAPRLPPGPAQLPVLGNLHLLGTLPHQNLRELARRHGPVMLLRLGTVPAAVVSSAEAAREMLKAHDVDCCSRPVSPGSKRLSYDLKDVAFAPYGEYWREMRSLLIVELLSMRRVRAARRAREQEVDKLVADLTHAAGAPVALNEHIFSLADGIIGTVAFGNISGTEWFAHKERFQLVVEQGMDLLASFSAEDFFPNAAGRLVDRLTGLAARRERVFRDLDAFCEMVIEQHTDPARPEPPDNGGDLVDALINLCKEHRGTFRFTREHVKAIILDAFLAGIDTVAVTLIWAMSEMMRKPQVLRKAQDEVRAAVGDDRPRVDSDAAAKIPYLKMVVKETLRLHPPSTLMPRETIRDVRVCGYDVPAKTRVFVNLWAIGRDPASWAAAEEFDPERFEGSDVDYNGAHFELLPFGSGRRICPGLAMGEANVLFALANLLYCFDWALPEGMEPEDVSMEEAGVLTFKPKTPLLVVPTRHQMTAAPGGVYLLPSVALPAADEATTTE